MAGNSGVPSPRQPGRASSSSARAAVPSGPGQQPARRDAPAQSRAPPRPRALGTRGRGRACPPPRAGCPPKRGGLEEPGLGASFFGVAGAERCCAVLRLLHGHAGSRCKPCGLSPCLVPSPKCPAGGTRIDVVVPLPLSSLCCPDVRHLRNTAGLLMRSQWELMPDRSTALLGLWVRGSALRCEGRDGQSCG